MRKDKAEIDRIRGLARVDRFKNFSDDEIATVVDKATYVTVPEGWAIIAEKTTADKAYLILSGEVSVRHGSEELARVGAGEVIGEMALVSNKLRSATVVSVTPLEALHFTSETVADLQQTIPHFKEALTTATDERHERDDAR